MEIDEIKARLEEDPGDPVFAELGEAYRIAGDLQEALWICLRGLSSNPDVHQGRLLLARIFYQLEYFPFAVRELRELAVALPENEHIRKLLEGLSPGSSAGVGHGGEIDGAEVVAESDFDIDVLEDIEVETE